ncbi:adenosylcobinamide-GDP ribazoletransferase [endosymbiont 'TC1' of Trimyema compressum]|uniref:adenosylcobinamide-GDP ribazoletransferase n=1 Tax=endosymbiont 'TC1' of Trimyema compressum TaxID=243899 RepID=UPI00248184AD|nr:adenosylcobinamide-GDP ribazoletransferase [endosymbiont 'TC1' of Trimyema compressum]
MSLQFLTKIPIPIRIKFNETDFGKCAMLSPLVGVILGTILALIYYLFSFLFPPLIVGFICLIIYVFLTGGLHLDGLGDTFDGVFSYREKDKIIEIMKDSRLGTNGLLAILFILILDGIFIGFLPPSIGGAIGIFLIACCRSCKLSCDRGYKQLYISKLWYVERFCFLC